MKIPRIVYFAILVIVLGSAAFIYVGCSELGPSETTTTTRLTTTTAASTTTSTSGSTTTSTSATSTSSTSTSTSTTTTTISYTLTVSGVIARDAGIGDADPIRIAISSNSIEVDTLLGSIVAYKDFAFGSESEYSYSLEAEGSGTYYVWAYSPSDEVSANNLNFVGASSPYVVSGDLSLLSRRLNQYDISSGDLSESDVNFTMYPAVKLYAISGTISVSQEVYVWPAGIMRIVASTSPILEAPYPYYREYTIYESQEAQAFYLYSIAPGTYYVFARLMVGASGWRLAEIGDLFGTYADGKVPAGSVIASQYSQNDGTATTIEVTDANVWERDFKLKAEKIN